MNTEQLLISGWTWNPAVILPAIVALVFYVIAFRINPRIWYFIAAVGIVFLALVSPINTLADGYLFSAHMLQHMLLLLIIPALLLLSLPRSFAAPRFLGKGLHPVAGWMAGVGSMWFWHAPALCNAATTSKPVFAFQTISLLVFGGIFWWQVIAPRDRDRLSPPAAIIYLFTACTACTVLGIILTFSPVAVCSAYMHPADPQGLLNTLRTGWGMTPEKDQQIGGLLMWVPMCTIYLTAIFAQLVRWFSPANPGYVHASREENQ